jgi:hypothetical protein
VSTDPHEAIRQLINRPDAAEVVRAIRQRFVEMPKGRLVNTREWNAFTVGEALLVIDEVAAEFGIEGEGT